MTDLLVPGYGDTHRAFLQAMLARNTITWATAQPLIAAISSAQRGQEVAVNDITQDDLESHITMANRALSHLDLEIRETQHQTSRERIYALVNTNSDPITQLATTYSADEITFVKKMLDTMFRSNNRGGIEAMCISSIEAVQLPKKKSRRRETIEEDTPPLKMTGNEVEALLRKLEAEGWLEKSDAGFYTLSPRALMELKGWLVDTYNDVDEDAEDERQSQRKKIKSCHACKEIITIGQRCARRECDFRLHEICVQNYFRTQRTRGCPTCKTEWDGKFHVGEKAITTSDRYQGRGGVRQSGAARRSTADNEDDREVGEEEEGSDEDG